MSDRKILRIMKYIGPRIGDAIKTSSKKQVDIARALGMPDKGLSPIINGRQNTSLDMIEKISDELGIAPAVLFPDYEIESEASEDGMLIDAIHRDMKHLNSEYLDTLKLISGAMRKRVQGKN